MLLLFLAVCAFFKSSKLSFHLDIPGFLWILSLTVELTVKIRELLDLDLDLGLLLILAMGEAFSFLFYFDLDVLIKGLQLASLCI